MFQLSETALELGEDVVVDDDDVHLGTMGDTTLDNFGRDAGVFPEHILPLPFDVLRTDDHHPADPRIDGQPGDEFVSLAQAHIVA